MSQPALPLPPNRFRPFVTVFTIFALLLTAANLDAEIGLAGGNTAAEAGQNPTLARVVYSIWITFVLATPAVVLFGLFDIRCAPPAVFRYWQLFWCFAFLAYVIHLYFAGVWFDWDLAQIARRQSVKIGGVSYALIACSNCILALLWGVDVAVTLVAGQQPASRWFYRFQWLTAVFMVASVWLSAVKFKSGLVVVLGAILTAAFVLASVTRLIWGDTSDWVKTRIPSNCTVPETSGRGDSRCIVR